METTISFQGFYSSIHESLIYSEIESCFGPLANHVSNACDFRKAFNDYAKYYAEQFAEQFKIKMQFIKLQSPREYNFMTDRIFCSIEPGEVTRLLKAVDKALFTKQCADMFTSRSGFVSFYNPDFTEWGDCEEWDANQVGALISAYADQESGAFDLWAEAEIMERAQCNGLVIQWIESATPDISRFYKIRDYLETRENRNL